MKLPGLSSGPALPALLILPTHSAASTDPPPPSPITLTPSSGSPSYHHHPTPVRQSMSRSPPPQPPARLSGQTTPPKEHLPPSARPKIVDRWANGPVIGVKPVPNGKGRPMSNPTSPIPGAPGKIALPGLSRTSPPWGTGNPGDCGPSPDFVKEPPQEESEERSSVGRKPGGDKPQPRRPVVPHKPSRIPSTGNRATVMDVAQVWSEHEKQDSQHDSSPRSTSPSSPLESRSTHLIGTQAKLDHHSELKKERGHKRERQEQVEPPGVAVKTAMAGWGTQTPVPTPSTVGTPLEPEKERGASLKLPDLLTPTEKSTSSWEKYSELIMPALEEEWTPVPSPMPTLNKLPEVSVGTKEGPVATTTPETKGSQRSEVDYLPLDLLSTTLEPERKIVKVSLADLVTFGRKVRLSSFAMLIPR